VPNAQNTISLDGHTIFRSHVRSEWRTVSSSGGWTSYAPIGNGP
jgi:hypothetical protein